MPLPPEPWTVEQAYGFYVIKDAEGNAIANAMRKEVADLIVSAPYLENEAAEARNDLTNLRELLNDGRAPE